MSASRLLHHHARRAAALVGATASLLAGAQGAAHAARPSPGAITNERLKLPSGPSSVRGLADEPQVDPFYAQVSHQVPIDLPEGLGKLAPKLALTYSGALGNGPLGIGWTLGGTKIERSTRLGVPRFDESDELEISGVASGRLVAIGGGEYRVEGKGQTVRVRRVGDGFEVDDGTGTRLRLGVSAQSRQGGAAGATRTQVWLVEDEQNQAGEHIRYEYGHDQGQVYLSRIVWGPGEVYGVELTYETRPDPVTSYREGFLVVTGKRLAELRVQAFGTERRAYQLAYDETFPVSRLAGVTSTGREGEGSWPALSFDYATSAAPVVEPVPGVGNWRLNASGISLVDLDGDGAAELLQLADGGHTYRVNQEGSFAQYQPITGNTQSIATLQLMDIDGDARADLLQDTGNGWAVWKYGKTKWLPQAALLPGGVWPGTAGLALKNPNHTRFADVNGDGLIDAIRWDNDNLKIHQATRTGFLAAREVPRIGGTVLPAPKGRFQDANGDGLDDYLELHPDRIDVYIGRGDGSFDAVDTMAYPFPESVTNPDDIHLADLDRDDLLDLVRVDLGTVRWFRGLAGGAFRTAPVTAQNPEALTVDVVVAITDVNGNGSQDVVWSSASGMWRMDIAGATTAGMLVGAQNGLGLDVSFAYRSSHALSAQARQAGEAWLYEIPMAMPVPVEKTTVLGPGETTRKINYTVRDGYWDAAERRFGGFMSTIVTTWGATPAETSSVITRYHNGTGAAGMNRILRGQVLVEQVKDGTGRRLSMTSNTWEPLVVAGLPSTAPLLRRAVLKETRTRYEDTVPVRETRATHEYDTLGRVKRTVEHGRLDLDHDDSILEKRHADDDTTWVRDQVCEEKVLGADGQVVGLKQHLFGDELAVQPLCMVGKGWPRETRAWLADEGRFVTTSATSYDAHGNPVSVLENGVTRELLYDANGLFPVEERVEIAPGRELVWRMTWDPVLGVSRTLEEPNGHTTHASYDSLGRFTGLALDDRPAHMVVAYDWVAPFPKTTIWEFDGDAAALGAPPATWSASSRWRQSVEVSNGLGEVRYRAVRAATDKWIISDYQEHDPGSRVVFAGQSVYASQLEHAGRPAGMVGDQLFYDPLGRLIEQRLPTGARRLFTHGAFERTTRESDLAPVRNLLDGQGRVIMTERSLADGTHETVEARYDAAGRLTRMWLAGGAVERSFRYDTLGRLVETYDPDLGPRTLRWDDGSRLTEEVNAIGQVIRYDYDPAGRLSLRDAGPTSVYRYHYDDARPGAGAGATRLLGRLAWIEEPTGMLEVGYDELGRSSFARRRIDDHVAEETTTYSPSGLVLGRSHDDGLALTYQYDPAGRAAGAGDLWQLLDQDAEGRPLHERFQNGAEARYQRDALGLASKVTVRDVSGVAIYDVDVTRNGWTGIENVVDVDGVGLDHGASFDYDGFARLTGATIGTGTDAHTFGYGYDVLHNMRSRTVVGPRNLGVFAGTYRYGEGGVAPRQLTSITGADGAVAHTFGYDAAGRQIAQDGLSLDFDALDRLQRVDGLPGGSVQHAYGHDGLRVKTTAPGGGVSYWFSAGVAERHGAREHDVVIGDRVVARITLPPAGAGSEAGPGVPAVIGIVITWLPWGLALIAFGWALVGVGRRSRPLRAVSAGMAGALLAASCAPAASMVPERSALWGARQTVFMHLGVGAGPVVFTDAAGRLLEERRYEPYGEEIDARVQSGSGYVVSAPDLVARDRNALNKRTDTSTGWSDHGARWLAPETARWLTPDPPVRGPSSEFLFAPWDLHPYQYVAQNPVLYWDPDGRQKAKVNAPASPLQRRGFVARVFGANYTLNKQARDILNPIFKTQFNYDVSKIKVRFGYTGGAAAFTWGDTITLDSDTWDTLGPRERIMLIAHEATHSVQFEKMGNTSFFNFSATRFLNRYRKEYGRSDNYVVPQALSQTPIGSVDPVDKKYTLDQIAERVSDEIGAQVNP